MTTHTPKKILFVCDKNERTSFGRLTLNLVKSVAHEYDAHVLWLKTPKFFGSQSKSTEIKQDNEKFHEIWASSLYAGFISFRNPLKRMIRKIAPDCVFFIRPELGFLVPVAQRTLGKVNPFARVSVFIHDTFAETLYPHSLKFKLISLFYSRPTVEADSFVFNSKWTKEEASIYYGPKVMEAPGAIVGSPVNESLYNKSEKIITPSEKKAFRESLRIKNYDGLCLNVSLDEPRKNVDTFLEMARLCPETAFVRIGKLTERIREIINAKKLYNVFHYEKLEASRLREFYQYADLLVHPAFLEGFGLTPMEAFACGTPAVSAGTSALKENLDGICPLVYPADDVSAYVKVWNRVKNGENVVDWSKAARLLQECSMKSFGLRVCDFFKSIGL